MFQLHSTNQLGVEAFKIFSGKTITKLDGVSLVDKKKPSTGYLQHIFPHPPQKKLHVTCDTCNVTHDMSQVTGGSRLTFSQNFSSLALTVWELEPEVTCDT